MSAILLWTAMCPPLIVEDGEVGVDDGHSTIDSHVPPPPNSRSRGDGCG